MEEATSVGGVPVALENLREKVRHADASGGEEEERGVPVVREGKTGRG